jgi:hypothetical protein
VVVVHRFDLLARRSDPFGPEIVVEAGSSEPITELHFEHEGSREGPKVVTFPQLLGSDGRVFRRHGPKFGVNGTWPLLVTAVDALGRSATVRCLSMTVTF